MPSPSSRIRRFSLILGGVAIGTVVGFVAVNAISTPQKPAAQAGVCSAAVAEARHLAPLVHGELAALSLATRPLQVPDLAFKDEAGAEKKLSDWRGRTVLVNLWATWCVPCRKEMPALDRLQEALGSKDFEVVAINIDTRDLHKPAAFLKDGNMEKLTYYADSSAKVFQDLKTAGRALGMPTSILVDKEGCEIGTLAGPAEWDSEDAKKLISNAIKPVGTSF